MWIALSIYALVGVVISAWLPISLARTRRKVKLINPQLVARLSPGDRQQIAQFTQVVASDFSTWQLVLAGVLWPLQIVGFWWSRKLSKNIREANRCDCGRC